MRTVAEDVREVLIDEIRRLMQKAFFDFDSPLGPPCSRFYLKWHQEVDVAAVGASASGDPLACVPWIATKEIWQVDRTHASRLEPEHWGDAVHGEVRGALYRNGIVSFWVDSRARCVLVDRRYGPLHGYGVTYLIGCVDPLSLAYDRMRWRA